MIDVRLIDVLLYMFCFFSLDNTLYNMHGTYIKTILYILATRIFTAFYGMLHNSYIFHNILKAGLPFFYSVVFVFYRICGRLNPFCCLHSKVGVKNFYNCPSV